MILMFATLLDMQLAFSRNSGGSNVVAVKSEIVSTGNRPVVAIRAALQASLSNEPRCRISAGNELSIVCDYSAAPPSDRVNHSEPRLVLTHLFLSFKPDGESHMRVELTFKNAGAKPVLERRRVYLAIDGDTGQNYIRRVLPHVDFRQLMPGKSMTFSDLLLVGALQPARYLVRLWIPSPEPSLNFDPAGSWLLSSEGVADSATGMNTIATFTLFH